MKYANGWGAMYPLSNFGFGVVETDQTIWNDIFPIRYGFHTSSTSKQGWVASANSGGLEGTTRGLIWTLNSGVNFQVAQSPQDLNIDTSSRKPSRVIVRFSNKTGDVNNDKYKIKLSMVGGSTFNYDFVVTDLTDYLNVQYFYIDIPSYANDQLDRLAIQTNILAKDPVSELKIHQVIVG